MRLIIANVLIVIAVALLNTTAASGQEFLYLPQPVVKGDDDPLRKDGVLVREVKVKKRDTLSGISKRFSGKGIYYPQILLFNSIRNPHLIHPGDLLRVPVTSKSSVVVKDNSQTTPIPRPSLKREVEPQVTRVAPPVEREAVAFADSSQNPVNPVKTPEIKQDEQSRYSRALATARKGNCRESIEMFNEFIRLYPQSALLPEATLNRAECYLKMSNP